MAKIEKTIARYPLRVARISQGMAIKDLANVVGIDERTMSRIEKGQSVPRHEVARKLFSHFGGEIDIAAIYDPAFYFDQNDTEVKHDVG